jgi:hypothetical protein
MLKAFFFLYKAGCLKKEVYRTKPFPSVSVPWANILRCFSRMCRRKNPPKPLRFCRGQLVLTMIRTVNAFTEAQNGPNAPTEPAAPTGPVGPTVNTRPAGATEFTGLNAPTGSRVPNGLTGDSGPARSTGPTEPTVLAGAGRSPRPVVLAIPSPPTSPIRPAQLTGHEGLNEPTSQPGPTAFGPAGPTGPTSGCKVRRVTRARKPRKIAFYREMLRLQASTDHLIPKSCFKHLVLSFKTLFNSPLMF